MRLVQLDLLWTASQSLRGLESALYAYETPRRKYLSLERDDWDETRYCISSIANELAELRLVVSRQAIAELLSALLKGDFRAGARTYTKPQTQDVYAAFDRVPHVVRLELTSGTAAFIPQELSTALRERAKREDLSLIGLIERLLVEGVGGAGHHPPTGKKLRK